MSLNKELLKILACPKCKADLELMGNEEGLKCRECSVVYPIKDEIPIMLIDEAVEVEEWEKGAREKK
ncbi:MAG: Trm112 family protein [Desulfonatronovibrio sp.]